jgi:hypothetical protein
VTEQPGVTGQPGVGQPGVTGQPDGGARQPSDGAVQPGVPAKPGALATHLAFGLIVLVVLAGFGLITIDRWRRGGTLIGAALLLAGGLRAVLSEEHAGLLAIRNRPADVLTYTAFGLALVAVAVTID